MANQEFNKKTYSKFKKVLGKAKLQCPTSAYDPKCGRHAGDFDNFANDAFFYKDKSLVFSMCNNHHRSELRFIKEWNFKDNKTYVFKATVKPVSATEEFTFIQIHGIKDNINKPVLRIALNNGKIRAIVFDGKHYYKKTLEKYKKERFINFKIKAGRGVLRIYKDHQKVMELPISYPSDCFFKCGVYLQRKGCAKAYFKKIGGNL